MPWSEKFPDADAQALDLLDKMLQFHPGKRIDVAAALKHPWLAQLHDETQEPAAPSEWRLRADGRAGWLGGAQGGSAWFGSRWRDLHATVARALTSCPAPACVAVRVLCPLSRPCPRQQLRLSLRLRRRS